ncbi:MAG: IclR family transcriptional regulator [Candidatus Dormibacteraeota bacterium]|nr:IclR family transcriptional regulator [Candidatus Dormibacteraeota bacterium]
MAASSERILVLGKARDLLDCFSPAEPELGFGELRRRTHLPPSTCSRLVSSLTELGFLERRGESYRPGARLVRWSAARLASAPGLQELARRRLEELRDETGETSRLYVRDGLLRVCVAAAETRRPVGRAVRVGEVLPLYAGAAGKVFLAFDEMLDVPEALSQARPMTAATITAEGAWEQELRRIRRAGYAASFGEREGETAAVAAPVRDPTGKVVAALGIGAPRYRLGPRTAARLAPLVVEAAESLSSDLGADR